jgi:hypothetical protein
MPELSGWGLFAVLYAGFVLVSTMVVSIENHKHPESKWIPISTLPLMGLVVVALVFAFAPKNEPVWFIPLILVTAGPLAWLLSRGYAGRYGILQCLSSVAITVAAFYNRRFPVSIAQGTAVIVGIYLIVEGLDNVEREGWLDGLRLPRRRHPPIKS